MTLQTPPKPPPPHVSPAGTWLSKLALRIIQFALSVAIIGLVASILNTGLWSIATLVCIMPQAILSAIWTVAETICLFVRGGHRGIHPGANVALDLLLWLGFIGGTAALWLLGIAAVAVRTTGSSYSSGSSYSGIYARKGKGSSSSGSSSGSDYYGSSGYDDSSTGYSGSSGYSGTSSSSSSSGSSSYYDDVLGTVTGVQAKGKALVGLGATLVVLHFITFVIACVETHIRNRRRSQVVYMAGQPQVVPLQNSQSALYAPVPTQIPAQTPAQYLAQTPTQYPTQTPAQYPAQYPAQVPSPAPPAYGYAPYGYQPVQQYGDGKV